MLTHSNFIGLRLFVFEDSDLAIQRFIQMSKKDPIFMQALAADENQVLALVREWHIEGFNEEIIETFHSTWIRVGSYLSDILVFLGEERLPPDLPDCFRDSRDFRYKKYHGLYKIVQEDGVVSY